DVIYCDHANVSLNRDLEIESQLTHEFPGVPWSVHNQARMHEHNGDAPYRNSEDAIRYWPETATAIAARLRDGRVHVIAPLGTDDLVGMIVQPSPAFVCKMELYRKRLASKDWARRWPRLRFVEQ